jgi:hypothetical protein
LIPEESSISVEASGAGRGNDKQLCQLSRRSLEFRAASLASPLEKLKALLRREARQKNILAAPPEESESTHFLSFSSKVGKRKRRLPQGFDNDFDPE